MTGEYYITKELLKQHSPCIDGYRWFCENYPNGGKYQEILDKLCADNRFNDACWLLDEMGATTDELEINTLEDDNKLICFAGSVIVENRIKVESIRVGGGIKAGWYIKAGEGINASWYIKAGEDIVAGGDIKAGWGIKAGWYIEAGEDIVAGGDIKAGWGIKAGGDIKAGGYIEAGNDYGIYAGLNVRLSEQEQYGYITAKAKPENIMCGNWKESEST